MTASTDVKQAVKEDLWNFDRIHRAEVSFSVGVTNQYGLTKTLESQKLVLPCFSQKEAEEILQKIIGAIS